MPINDYNVEDQTKLIKLAEYVMRKMIRRGRSADFESHDDFINAWEAVEGYALSLFPNTFEEDK